MIYLCYHSNYNLRIDDKNIPKYRKSFEKNKTETASKEDAVKERNDEAVYASEKLKAKV